MKANRKFHPRDASHPDGKPEPKRHCAAKRKQGRHAIRQAARAECRAAMRGAL